MEPLFDFYAEHAGCGIGSVSARLACLRNASISALARAQDTAQYHCTAPFHLFHPTLDGKLIVDTPTVSILQGNLRDIPIIVGATSNETLSGGDIPTALKAFFPGLNDNDIDEYLEVYPSSDFDSDGQREQVATGESELICAREIIGRAAAKKSKAWTYRYNQAVPTSGSSTVGHASENWMMFKGTSTGFNGSTVFQPMRPADEAFAEELIAYWLSFVRAGDPNTYKLARSPMWPSYTINKKERIVLQEGPDNSTTVSGSFPEVEPDLETKRCLFVASKVHQEQD
ncbi:Acetylcholinesterase [Grifola frondosa]|uniref:Acetylcholinesterase n=1 Tax=Grifola frondosa TaxID=5627 RepID=A0A1C7LQ37_GRIFR|nr:Acetylcholinesterase [Grifola frondosa]